MIKNNFIITEEERNHILNLTRLDNYRKPIRLVEDAATITAQRTYGMGGGNSPKEMTQQKTLDYDSAKNLFTASTINGGFGEIKLAIESNDVGKVHRAYTRIQGLIMNYYRGDIFGYFKETLRAASQLYPGATYNNMTYQGMLNDLVKKGEDQKKILNNTDKGKGFQQLTEWNSFTNPTPEELSLYEPKPLGAPIESGIVYRLKNQYQTAQSVGPKDVNKSTGDQSSQKDTVPNTNMEDFLNGLEKSNDDIYTNENCKNSLIKYVTQVVERGGGGLTDSDIVEVKKYIAGCNKKVEDETKGFLGIGKGKTRLKNNNFETLDRYWRKKLESLRNLPGDKQKFNVNFDSPDPNDQRI